MKTIESWKVVLTTTEGKEIDFEVNNSEATELIDELIENEHEVTWKE